MSSPACEVVRATLPCIYSGVFPHGSEASGVRFNAKKGESLYIELVSDRLGIPSAPYALFQRIYKNDKGDDRPQDLEEIRDTDKSIGDRDFNTSCRDPAGRVQVKEDGEYRVIVRNSFSIGPARSRQPFLLRVLKDTPDFNLLSLPAVPPKTKDDDRQIHVATTALRRGETGPVRVYVLRKNKFEGEVELGVSDLPPGVRAAGIRLAGGQNSGIILLTAAEDAVATNASIEISGKAKIGGNEVLRWAAPATTKWPVADYNEEAATSRAARTEEISVIAVESAPISIFAAGGKPIEAQVGAKVSIPLKVVRGSEQAGNFKLKPAGHTALDKAKEIEIDAKATNAVAEIDLNDLKLPEGNHTLWFQGQATVKYRGYLDALAAAEDALKTASKAVESAAAADKKAAEERKKMAEERKKASEEKSKPRDVTLMIYSEPFVLTVKPAKPPDKS